MCGGACGSIDFYSFHHLYMQRKSLPCCTDVKSKGNQFLTLKKLPQITVYKMMMKWYETKVKNWTFEKE